MERLVGDGDERISVCLAVLTQNRSVTDTQTDGRNCYKSR